MIRVLTPSNSTTRMVSTVIWSRPCSSERKTRVLVEERSHTGTHSRDWRSVGLRHGRDTRRDVTVFLVYSHLHFSQSWCLGSHLHSLINEDSKIST